MNYATEYYTKPKQTRNGWLILPGHRRLCPIPYRYVMPDLSLAKKKK